MEDAFNDAPFFLSFSLFNFNSFLYFHRIFPIMKLTLFKGLAYDLADHISFLLFSGQPIIKVAFPVDKDVLKGRSRFDQHCVNFVRDRAPANFDFSRIKKIHIRINRSGLSSSTHVEIQVDDKTFSSKAEQVVM